MKKYLLLIVILLAGLGSESATIIPASSPAPVYETTPARDPLLSFSTLSMKEIQQIVGRKLKLKEKIAVKILQWKIKKGYRIGKQERGSDPGKTALIFGILGLALLFVPAIGPLAALISAILALVLGYSARRKNPDDRKAKTAILLGWLSIGLFILALVIVIAVLATWTGGIWG